MGSPSMNWGKALAHPLELTGGPGGTLATLRCARNLFADHFATRSRPELMAIERLRRAAATGRVSDINVATEQIENVLRARGWM